MCIGKEGRDNKMHAKLNSKLAKRQPNNVFENCAVFIVDFEHTFARRVIFCTVSLLP